MTIVISGSVLTGYYHNFRVFKTENNRLDESNESLFKNIKYVANEYILTVRSTVGTDQNIEDIGLLNHALNESRNDINYTHANVDPDDELHQTRNTLHYFHDTPNMDTDENKLKSLTDVVHGINDSKQINISHYHRENNPIILLLNYRKTSEFIDCAPYKCRVTNNLSDHAIADAVLFHVFYMSSGVIPRHAHPRQVFVFLDFESQSRTYYLKYRSSPFAFLNDYYNITMTFRDHPDTDIYVPYGTYVDRDPDSSDSPLPSIENIKNKQLYVVWIVSNCHAPSSRMAYYSELSKHIPVDVYGKCGNKTCGDGCYTNISRDYRFYLAFENSFCDGYATEKVSHIYSCCLQ